MTHRMSLLWAKTSRKLCSFAAARLLHRVLVGGRYMMSCNVCDNKEFTTAEYRMDSCRAPALECTSCGALNLSERAANTQEERDSVKMAIAVRSDLIRHRQGTEYNAAPSSPPP